MQDIHTLRRVLYGQRPIKDDSDQSEGQDSDRVALMRSTAAAGAFPPPPKDHTTNLFLPIRHECNRTAVASYLMKHPEETKRTKRQQQTEEKLVLLHKIFASHGLPVILEAGSLLGFYRDCAVIPHDMDGDIGVFAGWLKGKAAPSELKKSFDAIDATLEQDFCPKGPGYTGCQMRVTFKDRSYVDIIVYATDLACLEAPCDYSWPLWPGGSPGKVYYKCDMRHVHFEQAVFLGKVFWIPAPALSYIKQNYGEKWDDPKGGTYKNCNFKNKSEMVVDQYQAMAPPASYALQLEGFYEDTHPRELKLVSFEVSADGQPSLLSTERIPE